MSNTPSDEELESLISQNLLVDSGGQCAFESWVDIRPELVKFARAVLSKWGTLRAEKIVIPTDTMEQEFQKHYRRGYDAGQKAAQGGKA